jgi:glycosyltransferase involved in cell wall biosynthesis
MASAKPVVAVLDTPYNMVVAAEEGLSTRPDQPEELARSILQLRKLTEQSRQTFGRNGRRYVEAHHDMANIAAQFSRILSGLTFRGAGLAAGAN